MSQLKVWTNGDKKWGYPLDQYIEQTLHTGYSSSVYDENPQNIEAKIERTNKAMTELVVLLREKGVLTDNEVLNTIGIDDYDIKNHKIVIKQEE